MQILTSSGGIAQTNCFLIADETTGKAVLFDAPDHTVGPLVEEAARRGWDVIGLWLTHGHFDHTADHAVVTKKFPNAKVLIHPLDEPRLQHPKSSLFPLPFEIPPRSADGHLADGQKLAIGNIEVEVIFTPGHSPGHVMFHLPKEKTLIGGDLIIMGAVGRTDLPDSNEMELNRSIRKIMKLPGDTRLMPGHGEASLLDEERENNPYVARAISEKD